MMNKLKASSLIFLALIIFESAVFSQETAVTWKSVEIYGQKIQYQEAGSGEPVILLHGLGGDSTNWAMTIPALAPHYHIYAPDQIGFGRSEKPGMNYRVATLVEFLDQFYQKLGISRATLVGNSLGGWTAASFTLIHPEKVNKLVLVDAAGYSSQRWRGPEFNSFLYSALNPSTTADLKRLFEAVFYSKAMHSQEFIAIAFTQKLKRGDSQTINAFIDSFLRGEDFIDEKVKSIKAPTLVVWGQNDGLTPLAVGEAFAQDIAGAQKVVIDKCGHVPQMEKPSEFNATLLKFLAGQ